MDRTIAHVMRLRGALKVPGDKSISHRALILGAAAQGKQVIDGIADSSDVLSTAHCLRSLGCFVERMPDGRTIILKNTFASDVTLDAGNSGTTARLVSGLVAGLGLSCTITGDASLRRRPMRRIADPLSEMGAVVTTSPEGTLPMTVRGGDLEGIHYRLPVASAQVKSAILIAGLFASGRTTVVEPVPTRDHTERMLVAMGVDVTREGDAVSVAGGSRLEGTHVTVPGDMSSAAYLVVAATCLPDADVFLPFTGVNPTRSGVLRVLERMGAAVTCEGEHDVGGEPVADVVVRSAKLRATEVADAAEVASIIDEIPILAVAATQAEGETTIRGAGELRHKESDRIAVLVAGLRALGADVEEHDDGLTVRGPSQLRGARVRSFGDHRIAMALAIAGLIAEGETTIEGAEAVDVSYPGFFHDLITLVR